jgi:hypothetical protein
MEFKILTQVNFDSTYRQYYFLKTKAWNANLFLPPDKPEGGRASLKRSGQSKEVVPL